MKIIRDLARVKKKHNKNGAGCGCGCKNGAGCQCGTSLTGKKKHNRKNGVGCGCGCQNGQFAVKLFHSRKTCQRQGFCTYYITLTHKPVQYPYITKEPGHFFCNI